MVELARKAAGAMSVNTTPFLAADVGGTMPASAWCRAPQRRQHARLPQIACARTTRPGRRSCGLPVQRSPGLRIGRCALAIAGYVIDGMVINYNLPWKVSSQELRRASASRAVAHQRFRSRRPRARFMNPARRNCSPALRSAWPDRGGGARHGLGSAVCIPGQARATVLATEAGQTSLAPGNDANARSWIGWPATTITSPMSVCSAAPACARCTAS